jgi:hypothetical protein
VTSCPTNTLIDTTTNSCVAECPDDTKIWYGNLVATQPICVIATNCPSNYFADYDAGICTQTCSPNTYILNSTNTCVYQCPDNLFKSSTRYCVTPIGCPTN